jgi:hypothetical protein
VSASSDTVDSVCVCAENYASFCLVCLPINVEALIHCILTVLRYRLLIFLTPLACSALGLEVITDPIKAIPGGSILLNFTRGPQDPDMCTIGLANTDQPGSQLFGEIELLSVGNIVMNVPIPLNVVPR